MYNLLKKGKRKSSESSKTKTPFTGECRYCYGNEHMKGDCKVRICDRENKVYRSCIRTNPFTKERSTDGKPVSWKKGPKGEIIVSYVQKIEDKKRRLSENGENEYPTPPASPFIEEKYPEDEERVMSVILKRNCPLEMKNHLL